jgi:uncharacterized glyoxalase superfamily protein PhnB
MTEEEQLSILKSKLTLRNSALALEFYERVFVAAIERGCHIDTAQQLARQAKEMWKAEAEAEAEITLSLEVQAQAQKKL